MGDAVDEAGQPARALEQGLDGGGLEQGEFAACETQAVGEVVVELVAVECVEVAKGSWHVACASEQAPPRHPQWPSQRIAL